MYYKRLEPKFLVIFHDSWTISHFYVFLCSSIALVAYAAGPPPTHAKCTYPLLGGLLHVVPPSCLDRRACPNLTSDQDAYDVLRMNLASQISK